MGLLVQKFLRYRVYGSYGISVVNTKMFINKNIQIQKKLNKESWHCSITQAVICAPVATPGTPPYDVNVL